MAASSSSSKALNAILPLITAGQPYEAHQKARTFASRYQKSRQFDTAIDVLFQSARELLKAGQPGSGTDLASFLLEVYENKGETVTEESRGRLTQLIALTGSNGSWRKTLIDKAVAWSAKHGPCPAGDPDLQHYVGELLYKEGAFEAAEPHLLAAGKRDSARVLAQMFVDWSAAGGSPGTFALRGVLPYLLNGNILAARTFINSFTRQIISSKPSLASSNVSETIPINANPASDSAMATTDEIVVTTDLVLNWSQLAVRTCQRAKGAENKAAREAWVRLCGTYQSKGGLLANPNVRGILMEIAQLYFAIPPPRAQPANPFGDMLSSLLGAPAGGGGNATAPRRLAPVGPSTATDVLD
ncbi:hypothetical protein PUNSTDRAFT_108788 [Punctularia strigosozonata HHB-11173 SS5]|uniref:DUF410-domain-containing protein n=1 Tax=Punctularia strigosozonata (strain HHB-11173) TaxID=741275 RepID=R7S267_PUNST|nr:uncharacterized protein PUNSTDRAFT_108788 [Punctularia strigosozonata HHB-11173 SS5]EIN03959.1 hypothetical protein PUNSTDRAFT_108788 [Punctularia strigosozonata HHB-11173 SS5]